MREFSQAPLSHIFTCEFYLDEASALSLSHFHMREFHLDEASEKFSQCEYSHSSLSLSHRGSLTLSLQKSSPSRS